MPARSVPRRAPAAARFFALFLLAEAGGQKVRHCVEAGAGVRALGRHRNGGALRRCQREKPHDRPSSDRLAAARHGHVGRETLDSLHELGGRARMKALAVDDRQVAHARALRGWRQRFRFDGGVRPIRAHLPARTRDATLMYLRPASWACSTASPKPSSSRTLASLISMGRLMPATPSPAPPFMHEIARFEGVPPNISVRTTTP